MAQGLAGGAGWHPAPVSGLETRCSLGGFRRAWEKVRDYNIVRLAGVAASGGSGLGRGCGLATRAGFGLRNSLQLGGVQEGLGKSAGLQHCAAGVGLQLRGAQGLAGGAGWQPAPVSGLETRCSLGGFRRAWEKVRDYNIVRLAGVAASGGGGAQGLAGGAGWQPAPVSGLETRCSLGGSGGLGKKCGITTLCGWRGLQLRGGAQGLAAGNPRRFRA